MLIRYGYEITRTCQQQTALGLPAIGPRGLRGRYQEFEDDVAPDVSVATYCDCSATDYFGIDGDDALAISEQVDLEQERRSRRRS